MCWKQEWSHAINGINRALRHIQNAKEKLEKRAQERRLTAARARENGRGDIVKGAEVKFKRNLEGIRLCEQQMISLKENRSELLELILQHGFSQSRKPDEDRKWVKLLGTCRLCKSPEECLNQPCSREPYCQGFAGTGS